MDRYNHDLAGDDTDETDDSPLFGSFSSYSPQYRKQNSSRFMINTSDDANSSTTSPSSNSGKILTKPELRKIDVSLS